MSSSLNTTIDPEKLITFFDLSDKLKNISNEIAYLEKLLELARRKLSIKDLQNLGDYLAKIRKKLELLNLQKEKMLEEMRKTMPEYKKHSDVSTKIINFFFRLKENIQNEPETLIEITKRLEEIRQKAIRAHSVLLSAKESLEKILKSGEIKNENHLQKLNEEISSLENNTMLLGRIVNLLKITPEFLNTKWSLLGYFVVTEEPKAFLGIVTNVVISKRTLTPLLEISTENTVSESFLNELFKEVGADFKARSVEEFIDKLHEETRELFGIETDITPSILERIFARANIMFPKELQRHLKRQYSVKYYVDATKIGHERINAKKKIIKVFKGEFKFAKEEDVAQLPSLIKSSKELLFKDLSLGKYNYLIYTETILPNIGYSIIVLRRDENNEPVPDARFVRRVLEILEKTKKSPIKLGDKKLERMSDDRLIWILRLAIVKGIGAKYNVTEGNALRPRNFFQFLLEYNLPILYEDLLSAYFGVIPSANIVKINALIDFKVKVEPLVIKKWLNTEQILKLFRDIKPKEIVGLSFHKKRGISIKVVQEFSERKIYSFIKDRYGISEDILRKHVKNSIKRLLMMLIYTGKIATFEEYRALQEELGVKTIEYEGLIKSFKDPEVFLLYTLLQYL